MKFINHSNKSKGYLLYQLNRDSPLSKESYFSRMLKKYDSLSARVLFLIMLFSIVSFWHAPTWYDNEGTRDSDGTRTTTSIAPNG